MTKAMTLRLPDDMHARLRREAFDNDVSITALIIAAIELTDGADIHNEDGSITLAGRRVRAMFNQVRDKREDENDA